MYGKAKRLTLSGVSLLLPVIASAQSGGYEHGRASISIGAFITDRDTETRLDSNAGLGTDIGLEDDLGLDSSTTVFRFSADVWFKPRQRFDFSVFDLSRSASREISETIEFGDEIFAINTVVNTDSDLTITKLDYSFAVLSRPRGYLGLTGGLYVMDTRLSLSEATLGSVETEDLTAPLPVIGLRGEYAISDRFTLRGASQWFSIDLDDASGDLQDFYIGSDYRFGDRFFLGLAYNKVTMDVRSDDDEGWTGRLDWGYDGWLLYFKTEFGRD